MRNLFLVFTLVMVGSACDAQSVKDPSWVEGGWFASDDPDIALLIAKADFEPGEYQVAVQDHDWACRRNGGDAGRIAGSAISATLYKQTFGKDGIMQSKNIVMAILKKEETEVDKRMTIRYQGKTLIFVQTK